MPSFEYESLNESGKTLSGTIAAPDQAAAVRLLSKRGETPVSIILNDNKEKAFALPSLSIGSKSTRPSLKKSDVANLIRELATALEAGLPLMSSLKTVRKQTSGRAMPVILDHLIERVEAGMPLYQAAKEYGPPFDNMIVGMLRAADASGEMSVIMHQLADLMERSIELRRSIIGAIIYPMIVAVLVAISATLLVTYLIPNLIEPLAGKMVLPLPTRIVMGISDLLSSYGVIVVLAAGLGYLGFKYWLRIPENRFAFDKAILKVPGYGRLVRDVAVARFTRTLGTLSSSGLPILESLRITRDTLGNAALMKAIDDVQEQVTTGKPLAEPLESSGLFPPLLIQIVNLGERSGKLESMLLHAAGAFDRQVQNSIKIFSAILPPVLLIIMALIAGFILAAILLPLLELQSAIS